MILWIYLYKLLMLFNVCNGKYVTFIFSNNNLNVILHVSHNLFKNEYQLEMFYFQLINELKKENCSEAALMR